MDKIDIENNKPKNTKIIKIDRHNIDKRAIEFCADVIKRGGLVCFPTETVYGIGANAFDAEAATSIFKAKGRPADNPLIVHISDTEMLSTVTSCQGSQRAALYRLAERFWPGPLTIIADRAEAIPPNVSCGLDTVGIRFPSHEIARALISAAGVPIAAPSANISGRPSPTRARHVIEDMMGRADVIIDGGECDVGVESTVFDISGSQMSILRPGAVTLDEISTVITSADEIDWKMPFGADKNEAPRSPGMKYRHYSPKAAVIIYEGSRRDVVKSILNEIKQRKNAGFSVGVLATDESICYYKEEEAVVQSLGRQQDSLQQAANLFHCLRSFDDMGVDVILAEALPENGAGDAVMNRLYRAAGGTVINCSGAPETT